MIRLIRKFFYIRKFRIDFYIGKEKVDSIEHLGLKFCAGFKADNYMDETGLCFASATYKVIEEKEHGTTN